MSRLDPHTLRVAAHTYRSNALVSYPGPQRKADAAIRKLKPILTKNEYDALQSARICFFADPQGHPASEFNKAWDSVFARFHVRAFY